MIIGNRLVNGPHRVVFDVSQIDNGQIELKEPNEPVCGGVIDASR